MEKHAAKCRNILERPLRHYCCLDGHPSSIARAACSPSRSSSSSRPSSSSSDGDALPLTKPVMLLKNSSLVLANLLHRRGSGGVGGGATGMSSRFYKTIEDGRGGFIRYHF